MLSYGWIAYLFVTSKILGAFSELCAFTTSSTNVLNANKSHTPSIEECQWGCCGKTKSPCCSVPISLLTGVILGGIVILAVLTAVIYYYCVYRRGDICLNAFLRFQARQSDPDSRIDHGNTTHQTGSSDENGLPTYPGYNDAPPSYEEVMKGQTNSAFDPDTLDRDNSHGV